MIVVILLSKTGIRLRIKSESSINSFYRRRQKKLKQKCDQLEKKIHTTVYSVNKKKAADLCTVKIGRTLTYGLHTMKSSIDAVPRTKRSHFTDCKK